MATLTTLAKDAKNNRGFTHMQNAQGYLISLSGLRLDSHGWFYNGALPFPNISNKHGYYKLVKVVPFADEKENAEA